MTQSKITTLQDLAINTIRALSMDAVQKANSGHPGLPMGAAAMGPLRSPVRCSNASRARWVPRLTRRLVVALDEGELNPRFLKAEYRFRTVVYVTARIPYRHKFNPDNRFVKEQTLLLLREDGQWKVDLIALVRAPFSGV